MSNLPDANQIRVSDDVARRDAAPATLTAPVRVQLAPALGARGAASAHATGGTKPIIGRTIGSATVTDGVLESAIAGLSVASA